MSRREKFWFLLAIGFFFGLIVIFSLSLDAEAAASTDVQICTVMPNSTAPDALMGCPMFARVYSQPQLTDRVRWGNGMQQGWAIFSTLKPTDVVYERDGHWHVVSGIVITPLSDALLLADYTVVVDSDAASIPAAIFRSLPVNEPQCFHITNGTQSIRACVPANP